MNKVPAPFVSQCLTRFAKAAGDALDAETLHDVFYSRFQQSWCDGMREYDPSKPLIFSHIPKTAGSSLRAVFQDWFGDRCREHYRGQGHESAGLPKKVAIRGQPLVLFGHFNGAMGFGIRDYYPEVEQFLTVMREPFARAISGYFYSLGQGAKVPPIDEFIMSYPNNPGGILNYFPFRVTADNFRELIERHFVDIGTTETLPQSVARFARKLGKECPENIPVINPSRYTASVPNHLKDVFRERNSLEFEVYDYVSGLQQTLD